ncbi:hypothetical protein LVB87_01270 [Lysobacter sp. KIS68-7]|uniref:hypothetical protein n=1 Tax=Lysobacter sp. KIS68-7 TaxID=2904252 RepID=UPI001E367B8E|nr:hypothetical protein [Lysobacter sp. KIS68-7]UHQ19825.1 hypothetical protein LVB87_01270 [Lysobacter sp. KIS68-7]
MRLAKTGKARDALAAGKAGALDLRDRRILILADGQRTRNDVMAMLGADSGQAIDRLRLEGYLDVPEAAPAYAPVPAPAVVPAEARIVAPAPAQVDATPARSRRSLAATKMYMLDMLQLQRTGEAADLRLAIQTTSDQDLLIERLLEGMRHLLATTTASYGERVLQRFAEVLPEASLPRLSSLKDPSLAA